MDSVSATSRVPAPCHATRSGSCGGASIWSSSRARSASASAPWSTGCWSRSSWSTWSRSRSNRCPTIGARYALTFELIEYVSLAVFTVEYGLRLWVAVEHGPHQHLSGTRARLKYALSPAGLIDLVAVLPFWFAMVLPADFRFVLVFRMVRFFKIARYSPAMRSLLDVLYQERRALFGCLVITLGTALVTAALMHLAEGKVQPDKLGTIPDALWWSIVTVGTIGYGDVVPVTALGKLIATGTIFLGLIMMALPIGIIATAFSEQIHRRDFIVTWGMIARVPLFAELDAGEIADIMQLLRAQLAEAGEVIVREGEPPIRCISSPKARSRWR